MSVVVDDIFWADPFDFKSRARRTKGTEANGDPKDAVEICANGSQVWDLIIAWQRRDFRLLGISMGTSVQAEGGDTDA